MSHLKYSKNYEKGLEAAISLRESNPNNRVSKNVLETWHSGWNVNEYCPFLPVEFQHTRCTWWFIELTRKSIVKKHHHMPAKQVTTYCLSGTFNLEIGGLVVTFNPGNYLTFPGYLEHTAIGESFILTANWN